MRHLATSRLWTRQDAAFTVDDAKSLWTWPGKSLIYRPHGPAFHAHPRSNRLFGGRLQEPDPDGRPVLRPDDDSAAADGFGDGAAHGPVLSTAAAGAANRSAAVGFHSAGRPIAWPAVGTTGATGGAFGYHSATHRGASARPVRSAGRIAEPLRTASNVDGSEQHFRSWPIAGGDSITGDPSFRDH
jgi:hypothetical protein